MAHCTDLFVVYDPEREGQPALERAVGIAGKTSARLHLYACIHAERESSADESALIKALIAEQQAVLDKIAAELAAQGLDVSTEVDWDRDWYGAVVRSSKKRGSDVVLKSSYKHSKGQRIFRTSDRTLIRECLCPVLLVKEGAGGGASRILAAVDICAKGEPYEQLNRNVIDFSQHILSRHGAEVHFLNAFQDFRGVPSRQALIEHCETDSDHIHIKLGKPDRVIVDQARRLDVNLVVVGNSARSGLSGAFMGNTVEKVLDRLDCDVLAVPVAATH